MGRKKVPGLVRRGNLWHVDKVIFGRRICQSTGTARFEEAERYLARVMEQVRQAQIYGVRPARTFEQAAAKFVTTDDMTSPARFLLILGFLPGLLAAAEPERWTTSHIEGSPEPPGG